MHQHEGATADLRTLVESLQKRHDDSDRLTRDLQSELKTKIAEVDATVAKVSKNNAAQTNGIKKHTTSTVRDSSRQIESLVHIYQQYPEVKLPMPSTGGWAIDSQALAHMLALIEECQPQRILELGSGTSTIWAGYLCRKFGGKIVTLDHLEHYLNLTRTAVDRHQLNDVIESRLAPLHPTDCHGRTFNWYSTDSLQDLQDIDMVIIDGPPAATGPQARYPALPKVWEFLAPNATIILDDAHRQDEAEIVESWLSEYPDFEEIEHGTSRLAVLQRHVS
jgi:predicted O-methyltransferase YrrM